MKQTTPWTIEAIAKANQEGGGHFFSPGTMKSFGDEPSSFRVHEEAGRVFIVRVKEQCNAPEGYVHKPEIREFYPGDGSVSVNIADKPDRLPPGLRLAPSSPRTIAATVLAMADDPGFMRGKTTSAEVAILTHAPALARSLDRIHAIMEAAEVDRPGALADIREELEKLGYRFE